MDDRVFALAAVLGHVERLLCWDSWWVSGGSSPRISLLPQSEPHQGMASTHRECLRLEEDFGELEETELVEESFGGRDDRFPACDRSNRGTSKLVSHIVGAACRNRTDDLFITSESLWPTELRRRCRSTVAEYTHGPDRQEIEPGADPIALEVRAPGRVPRTGRVTRRAPASGAAPPAPGSPPPHRRRTRCRSRRTVHVGVDRDEPGPADRAGQVLGVLDGGHGVVRVADDQHGSRGLGVDEEVAAHSPVQPCTRRARRWILPKRGAPRDLRARGELRPGRHRPVGARHGQVVLAIRGPG